MPFHWRYPRHLYVWVVGVFLALTLILLSGSQADLFSSRKAQRNQQYILTPDTQSTPDDTSRPSLVGSYAPPNTTTPSEWTFAPSQHAESYVLDRGQCGAAFPKLYKEIQRAATYWESRRIGVEDVDISWKSSGAVRTMISGNRLYVLDTKFSGHGYHIHRALAILGSIHRAINSVEGDVPNVEFSFSVSDVADPENIAPGSPIWTFSRRSEHEHHWLMPDFGFWSWGLDVVGEYVQIRKQISKNERPFLEKIPRAIWRGAENSEVRSSLLRATKPFKSTWADIRPVTWSSRTKMSSSSETDSVTMPEHCRWQYLMHTEGVSYSGRGKYLFNCHSVVVAHQLEWIENWHHLLEPDGPGQNFVQVERDFSDLDNKMRHLLSDQEHAQRIADNSAATFRDKYLTPAAQACYWRELIRAWSFVSFEPEVWEEVHSVNKAGDIARTIRRPRGTPYETFMLTAFDELYDGCGWFKRLIGSC